MSPSRRLMYAATVAAVLALALAAQVWAVDPAQVLRREDGTQKLWVLFTDKGLTRAEEQSAIDAFGAQLPERALRRRAKVGFDVNRNDLPVAARYVDDVVATGATVVTKSRWLNAVSVFADDRQAAAIAALPFVRETRPVGRGTKRLPVIIPADGQHSPQSDGRALDYGESQGQLEQIQVDQLHDEGLDGTGVLIAMLDTGFDTDHQVYRHLNIVAERDFINDDAETADQPGDPDGQDAHGTATLSCVGGKYAGRLYGGSYEAGFILCKTEMLDEEIQTEEDYWEAAIEWADSLGADVVSSSRGYLDWYTYEDMDGNTAVVTNAADMAAARGIVVVNSMGNEGDDPWLYMIAPADGDSVLSIGAVDIDGDRVGFSSVGPTYDGRIKPDVMALGRSAYVATTNDTASYGYSSSTSFSCPLTAGAVGLLVQARPDWSPVSHGHHRGTPLHRYAELVAGHSDGVGDRLGTRREVPGLGRGRWCGGSGGASHLGEPEPHVTRDSGRVPPARARASADSRLRCERAARANTDGSRDARGSARGRVGRPGRIGTPRRERGLLREDTGGRGSSLKHEGGGGAVGSPLGRQSGARHDAYL